MECDQPVPTTSFFPAAIAALRNEYRVHATSEVALRQGVLALQCGLLSAARSLSPDPATETTVTDTLAALAHSHAATCSLKKAIDTLELDGGPPHWLAVARMAQFLASCQGGDFYGAICGLLRSWIAAPGLMRVHYGGFYDVAFAPYCDQLKRWPSFRKREPGGGDTKCCDVAKAVLAEVVECQGKALAACVTARCHKLYKGGKGGGGYTLVPLVDRYYCPTATGPSPFNDPPPFDVLPQRPPPSTPQSFLDCQLAEVTFGSWLPSPCYEGNDPSPPDTPSPRDVTPTSFSFC